jgi:tetratricopeptide (TPR) repeat protein
MDIDPDLAYLSRTVDAAVLGARIKAARVAAGLTQSELVGEHASAAYLSRIEAGARRPELRLLVEIARRANTTVEQLVRGFGGEKQIELRLTLHRARFALECGDPAQALELAGSVVDQSSSSDVPAVVEDAQVVYALALEALGRLDDAIISLEDIVAAGPRNRSWVGASVALARCHLEVGDAGRAITVGEALADHLAKVDLSATRPALELARVLARAHAERGRRDRAIEICADAVKAVGDGLMSTRAAAYRAASAAEAERGRLAPALILAEQAHELAGAAEEARVYAAVQSQLGVLLLGGDTPDAEKARTTLEAAATAYQTAGAHPAELADNHVALARALLLEGQRARALEVLDELSGLAPELPRLTVAEVAVTRAQAHAAAGDAAATVAAFAEAASALEDVQTDRRAAQLWFELGAVLDGAGERDKASDAYRRAAVSTGLTLSGVHTLQRR